MHWCIINGDARAFGEGQRTSSPQMAGNARPAPDRRARENKGLRKSGGPRAPGDGGCGYGRAAGLLLLLLPPPAPARRARSIHTTRAPEANGTPAASPVLSDTPSDTRGKGGIGRWLTEHLAATQHCLCKRYQGKRVGDVNVVVVVRGRQRAARGRLIRTARSRNATQLAQLSQSVAGTG